MKGLETFGFLALVKKFPTTFQPYMVGGTLRQVTGTDLLQMFIPTFSPEGSNQRDQEDDVMELWTAYIAMVDRGNGSVELL